MCTHKGEKTFKCHLCDMTFLMEDNLKSHMYEIHLEDEANHSMQSYVNIQSSTLIQSENYTFQNGIFDENIANHSNSSTRFNSLDEATFPQEYMPQNIQLKILPLGINVQTQSGINIPTFNEIQDTNSFGFYPENGQDIPMSMLNTEMSILDTKYFGFYADNERNFHTPMPNREMPILDRSTKHRSVSFAAGSIDQLSSISTRPEENPSNLDNISQVSSQYEMSSDRLILNTLQSMDEHQQLNIMEENELNANTTSTSTNIDMNTQMYNIHLEQTISDQNLTNSSTENHESFSFAFGELESNISTEFNILDLFPWLE